VHRNTNYESNRAGEVEASSKASAPTGMNSVLGTAIRWIGGLLVRALYRVRVQHDGPLPEGGHLLLPNHMTWVDAVLLQAAYPRPIRFLAFEEYFHLRFLTPLLHIFGALPVSPTRAKEAVRAAAEALRRGETVCLFPEGEISRLGSLLKLQRGFELIARESQVPVVPVWMDELWGSIFSFSEKRYFFKWPKHLRYPVTIAFGATIPAKEATVNLVRERMLDLGERCFQERDFLQGHLGRAAIAGLSQHPSAVALVDGLDGSVLSRGMLLATALTLAAELRKRAPEPRIAVVLPPGKGATVANLAVVLAGKVPVNLNFTAGTAAVTAAIRIAGLRTALSAQAFRARLPEFPWPEKVWFLEDELPQLKLRIATWRILVSLLPAKLLALLGRVPEKGDRAEAVVLFTSGSVGEPKGVILTHRNLLGNIRQCSTVLGLPRHASVLSCLPFFHSFGCTVTMWYPMLSGLRMVTLPSPLDPAKNAELIDKHQIKLLCSTPTFLRGYLRNVEPAKLRSLELIITGAEKLPNDLALAFQKRFEKKVLQGYGLTETSPVVSVNIPEIQHKPGAATQPSSRLGSVGKLMPGMTAEIRDPESGERLSTMTTGMLWLKGVNIFGGYLNEEAKTRAVLQDGWFRTGDLGRFDEDGFLYIEGRMSRFSKIGGEMVPHETVETAVKQALGVGEDALEIAVTGVAHESKGEALVVVTTRELDLAALRRALAEKGLPNLWIPRKLVLTKEIPHLASGKLDLRGLQALAADSTQEANGH
jgi:acyl-[acyl-carrier-protein]-phospholipid O-acyltransferase/long-chain-fatty-acid--[acyl-carrier-protein] ligase